MEQIDQMHSIYLGAVAPSLPERCRSGDTSEQGEFPERQAQGGLLERVEKGPWERKFREKTVLG